MTVEVADVKQRHLTELQARGFNPANPDAGPHADQFLQAICQTFTTTWGLSVTTPGPGPGLPTAQPHSHLIVAGTLTQPILVSTATVLLLPPIGDFVPGYGWEKLLNAWGFGTAGYVPLAVSDVKEGNDGSHTHSWMGLNASTLADLMRSPLVADPTLDLDNAFSRLSDYVDAASEALVAAILETGTTSPPIPVGTTHTHTLV